MSGSGGGPFREQSLERLSSPERLDELLRLADRKTWLPLATLGAIVLALGVWSFRGQVPVHVEGRGILVRPREMLELQAPGAGYLVELSLRVGGTVRKGEVVARIDRSDLTQQLELARAELGELTEQGRTAERPWIEREGARRVPADAVGASRGSRVLAERLREEELRSIERERVLLEERLGLARELARGLDERLTAQRGLQSSGVISREALVQAERDRVDAAERVAALSAELQALRTRELEAESRHLDRLERIADREQAIAGVEREIARLSGRLARESRIVAEQGGRVVEVTAHAGEYLSAGQSVGSLAGDDGARAPLVGLLYFRVGDGKRLHEEMKVQVTPDTVERRRFGAIKGRIVSVSPFPVSLAEAESNVGNGEIAAMLVADGYRIQALAELEPDESTPSGFVWSSSRGPDFPISTGTTTSARVSIEERPPVTFVFPFLKSLLGVD